MPPALFAVCRGGRWPEGTTSARALLIPPHLPPARMIAQIGIQVYPVSGHLGEFRSGGRFRSSLGPGRLPPEYSGHHEHLMPEKRDHYQKE